MESDLSLIAGIYRLIGRLGSGGGGIVYLAEHTRLDKKVVLKADKRTLSAQSEDLVREVAVLKNLSHTYIPQVYDYIEENGTVYTVMDYIDGESFDKPLKRGEKFTQAQVIEWACQLLEALDYLHSRPPHGILHADIKPANVMLTPQNDIRLIDYNIALALKEEGAVAVGRSFGYASPEHYWADTVLDRTTAETEGMENVRTVLDTEDVRTISDPEDVKTVLDKEAISDLLTVVDTDSASENKTVPETEVSSARGMASLGKSGQGMGGSTTSGKKMFLDKRSDIYSLGATLYHFLTGRRPDREVTKVTPIPAADFSPAVIAIIARAMEPDPDKRWQSAREMLHAFTHLRENDIRTKRYRRAVAFTSLSLTAAFLAGGFIAFVGLKQQEQQKNAYVMAEYSGNALSAGDVDGAIAYALNALPAERNLFTPPDTAAAQKALTDALRIYDLSDGFQDDKLISLPSAPLMTELSDDGSTAACIYDGGMAVFNTLTGELLTTLPVVSSALAEVRFLNNDTLIYAGAEGLTAYSLTEGAVLWTGRPATAVTVSADGSRVAAVYKDETAATVYDVVNGKVATEVDFAGKRQPITVNDRFANPQDNLFQLSSDGTLLAASFADGSLWLYDLSEAENNLEISGNDSGYTHFEGGFFGKYLAFSAVGTVAGEQQAVFAIIDTEKKQQTGGFEQTAPFGVQADESGIYVQTENLLVRIHPETGEQQALVDLTGNIDCFTVGDTHTAVVTGTEYLFFDKNARLISGHQKNDPGDFIRLAAGVAVTGSLDAPSVQIMRLENHPETEMLTYDPAYQHDEARVSADGKTVMLFSYDRFRLLNRRGEIITETIIPEANQIYDQQYRRDENGSRLEIIYNDGKILSYSAADGQILSEIAGEKPDLTLQEEFFTDTLRIVSPLHGTPAAYDRKSGRKIRELEPEAYLTYVTQAGEYVITEYITTQGERYGLLLNEKCETLARLPYLCDYVGGELIFNYPTGNLRKSRIYHKEELIGMARSNNNKEEQK